MRLDDDSDFWTSEYRREEAEIDRLKREDDAWDQHDPADADDGWDEEDDPCL